MTAGRGIMHAEMPLHEPGQPDPEGMQLWIDLPEKFKDVEPSYQEKKCGEVGVVRPEEGVEVKVISGESHGLTVSGCRGWNSTK